MISPSMIAQDINAANKSFAAQTLIFQAWATAIVEQPGIVISSDTKLKPYEDKINNTLETFKENTSTFLNSGYSRIVQSLDLVQHYYNFHNAVVKTMPKDATCEQWVASLKILQTMSYKSKEDIEELYTQLSNSHELLSNQSSSLFDKVVELNTSLSGDKGLLTKLNEEIRRIDRSIDKLTLEEVISGLGIIGGEFLILVGSLSLKLSKSTKALLSFGTVITGGSNVVNPIVSLKLERLLKKRVSQIEHEEKILSEVRLALGISNSCNSLVKDLDDLAKSVKKLESEWQFLNMNLDDVINDLKSDSLSEAEVHLAFESAAESIRKVLIDSNNIRRQLTGVSIVKSNKDQNIGSKIIETLQDLVV